MFHRIDAICRHARMGKTFNFYRASAKNLSHAIPLNNNLS